MVGASKSRGQVARESAETQIHLPEPQLPSQTPEHLAQPPGQQDLVTGFPLAVRGPRLRPGFFPLQLQLQPRPGWGRDWEKGLLVNKWPCDGPSRGL